MQTKIRILLCVLLLSAGTYTMADEVQENARKTREEVWNWDKPEFKNYQVPAEYDNESAVVLARHQDIEVRSRRIGMLLRLFYTEIDRRMVKINDNVSLEDLSELTFTEKLKMSSSGFGHKNRVETVIGVRIIKPDGSIREVDVDAASVLMTEGKRQKKESEKKLAVPGLQVGDILDYFYCESLMLDEYNPPAIWMSLYSKYPTLSYSARCLVNTKHLTVEYAVMNGAKDFTSTHVGDEETLLELHETNLPRVTEGRWMAYMRDTPIIRMHIYNNKNAMVGSTYNARQPGVYKLGAGLRREDVILDAKYRSVNSSYYSKFAKPFYKDWKKFMKKYFEKHPNLSDTEKATCIRDYLQLEWPLDRQAYNPYTFMCMMHQLLVEFKIPHDYLLMTDKNGPRMKDVLRHYDLDDAIRVGDKFYTYPYHMRVAGELYYLNQGQEAHVYQRFSLQGNKVKLDKSFFPEDITLPTTTADENKSIQRSEVALSEDNPLELTITRETVRSGATKVYNQNLFSSIEILDSTLRSFLKVEETLDEALKRRFYKTIVEQRKAAFQVRRESMMDSVKVEVTEFYDIEPKEVLSFQLRSLGVVPTHPNLEATTSYTIDGLVKKAGNNYIIDAGKLIGSQWEPTDKDRTRTVNAYLSTPQTYENEITIRIPEGYEAVEAEKLNISVDNPYGSFRSSATVEGNAVKIHTLKTYKKNFVPFGEWPKFMEVIDAASRFNTLSVVMKKL